MLDYAQNCFLLSFCAIVGQVTLPGVFLRCAGAHDGCHEMALANGETHFLALSQLSDLTIVTSFSLTTMPLTGRGNCCRNYDE